MTPDNTYIEKAVRLEFHALNNEAEYEDMIAGLEMALDLGLSEIIIFSDSQLVVNQDQGGYGILSLHNGVSDEQIRPC